MLFTWAPSPVDYVVENASALTKNLVLGALRQGPIPQHIAFVMDGNRRYARQLRKEVSEGHNAGFEALARTLEICYRIGVRVVTVYAFSIENFKRTKYEVDTLMDMAKMRLSQIAAHGAILHKYGAKIQLLGRRDLVRPDVLESIDEAIDLTKDNTRAILNICAPYTSREEMASSIRKTVAKFCGPLPPRLKRPFSETHIARNIQAQRLGSLQTNPDAHVVARKESQSTHVRSDVPPEDGDHTYTPSTAETTMFWSQFNRLVAQLLIDTTDEHVITVDSSVVAGASSSIVECLRDTAVNQDEKLKAVSEIIDGPIKPDQVQLLQTLAEQLVDYEHASDSATTLNQHNEPIQILQPRTGGYPDVERITEDTLNSHTYTGSDIPHLDLLVRTSGVERLSDFMLWQCHQNTEIAFVDCYWPDFGLWHFIPLILEWQWKQKKAISWKGTWHGSRQKVA